MELRDYIEMGATKAGSLTALGKMLDLTQPQISTIKAHGRPIPDKQLIQLAEFINVTEKELIAANNIAMGKHVEFWTTFVQHAKAASIVLALSLVTNFVTPSPANAGQMDEASGDVLYYVKFDFGGLPGLRIK